MRRISNMVQSDDIFRQISKSRKRTKRKSSTDETLDSIATHIDENKDAGDENVVTEVEGSEETENDLDVPNPVVEEPLESEPEVVTETVDAIQVPEEVKYPVVTTEVVGDVQIKGRTQIPVGEYNPPPQAPAEVVESQPEPNTPTSAPETTEVEETTNELGVPKHPDYERTKVNDNFEDLSVADKLLFSDIFVKEEGQVVFNSDHEKSVAKNLSRGVIDRVVEDLRNKHRNVLVSMGSNAFVIREDNSVFTTTTSLMRFLLLNGIEDDNTALQLARQLYLEKHPDGEKDNFDHTRVRTDERDVYALLLSSKKDPERDLTEKVEELIRSVEYAQETTALTDRKILNHTEQSNHVLNGLNIATSLLVLERLGLTKGSLPNTIDEMHGFITQDDVVTLSDLLGNDIAMEVDSRKRTLARDARMRKQVSPRRQPPRSALRYSERDSSNYSR